MKGCFLLQRRFAYLSHDIAATLKEQYGVTEFCGYVYQRISYEWLQKQTDISYTSLLFDEEIHNRYKEEAVDTAYLQTLEREYGIPNLWPYLSVDRTLMYNQLVREYPHDTPPFSHEEMLRMLQVHAKAVISFLEQEKPDFVFGSVFGGLGSLLLYHIAKKKGIPTFVALPTCTDGRYLISEKYDYFTGVEERFAAYLKNPAAQFPEAEQFLTTFRAKPTSYSPFIKGYLNKTSRMKQLSFLRPDKLYASLRWYLTVLKTYLNERAYNDYSTDMHPWYYIVDHVKRKVRDAIGFTDLYDEFTPDEDFAFFPLHFEPEIALLLQAPNYTDQVNLIGQIARSLPVHYKLYIKEHPAMVEYRPRAFYKAIKKNPNVKLINPGISSFNIIPKAKLTLAITGTAAWEAVLFKKPVVTFGEQFYNALPIVRKCNALKDLPYLIQQQLKTYTHGEKEERELLAFVQAIFDESIPMNMTYLWEHEGNLEKKRAGIAPLAQLLAKKINARPTNAAS